MFKEIDKYRIKIVKIINSNKRSIYYVPNFISMGPMDKLFIATEWLVGEALKDYILTYKTIKEQRKHSQEYLDDVNKLSIRLGSRTLSYINQLCLMEDILTHEYKRMTKMLSEASKNRINLNPVQDYKDLKNRFDPIRTFRKKVAAHIAYTYPRKDDNPETVVGSIYNLFPMNGGITVGNQRAGSSFPSQLPVITIFEWEEIDKLIFQDWKKLFIGKLNEIHKQCPLSNREFEIEVATPHLIQKNQN